MSTSDLLAQLAAGPSRCSYQASSYGPVPCLPIGLAGRSTQHVPTFPTQLGELAKDARRAGEIDVPLPIPSEASGGSPKRIVYAHARGCAL